MSVINQYGEVLYLKNLWDKRRAVIVFTRHMSCKFCKETVSDVKKIQSKLLKDISLVIVTIGLFTDIEKFKIENNFNGEVYVDSCIHHPESYSSMRLENGPHVLYKTPQNPEDGYLEATKLSLDRCLLKGFEDGGFPIEFPNEDENSTFTGDDLQIGGVFVLGPGNTCDFSHRSVYLGDTIDYSIVVAAANGKEESGVNIVYPTTVEWNNRLKVNDFYTPPILKLKSNSFSMENDNFRASVITISIMLIISNSILLSSRFNLNFPFGHRFVNLFDLFLISNGFKVGDDVYVSVFILFVSILFIVVTSFYKVNVKQEIIKYNKNKSNKMQKKHKQIHSIDDQRACTVSKEIIFCKITDIDTKKMKNSNFKSDCPFLNTMADTITENLLEKKKKTSSDNDNDSISSEREHVSRSTSSIVQSMTSYIREFLDKSNPYKGTNESIVCPYISKAINLDSIRFAVLNQRNYSNEDELFELLLNMIIKFKQIDENMNEDESIYNSMVLIFPEMNINLSLSLLDRILFKVNSKYCDEGLLINDFHMNNNKSSSNNANFFPFRTLFPCLVIRNILPSDLSKMKFHLSSELKIKIINKYIEKHNNFSFNETEIAKKLLMEIKTSVVVEN